MSIHRYFETYVFAVSDFISGARCDEMIARAEQTGFDEATINTPHGAVRATDVRNNDRVIADDPALAAELWALAAPHVPSPFNNRKAVGLNERFRFYRYEVGQLLSKENPRLCRGGSRSLTFTEVHQRSPDVSNHAHGRNSTDGRPSEPKSHEMGLQISHRVHPEVQEKDALCRAATSSW